MPGRRRSPQPSLARYSGVSSRVMWALDLGTTNSLLARWDKAADKPALLDLPEITRRAARTEVGDASRAVPSALHVLDEPTFWAKLGPVSRGLLIGRMALIGREALD